MKAIVSITNDPLYSFFLPIITWCWNKLGADVICFVPGNPDKLTWLAMSEINKDHSNRNLSYGIVAPENKMPTYAQCSRLYAASLGFAGEETLITSDVDMIVFKDIFGRENYALFNLGHDLVPIGQLPICYTWGPSYQWRLHFNIHANKTYKECLDEQLAHEECENMRGNLWSRDQELLYNAFKEKPFDTVKIGRARPGTQFATGRLDRDDAFLLDRLSPDIIDYHMPRHGYEDASFNQILTVLKYFYPNDNFDWLINYRNEYIKLL